MNLERMLFIVLKLTDGYTDIATSSQLLMLIHFVSSLLSVAYIIGWHKVIIRF